MIRKIVRGGVLAMTLELALALGGGVRLGGGARRHADVVRDRGGTRPSGSGFARSDAAPGRRRGSGATCRC